MRNGQTKELVTEIKRSPDLVIGSKVIRGGSCQGTWVCKEQVYAYAMWISARFHLQVIRAFNELNPINSPIRPGFTEIDDQEYWVLNKEQFRHLQMLMNNVDAIERKKLKQNRKSPGSATASLQPK